MFDRHIEHHEIYEGMSLPARARLYVSNAPPQYGGGYGAPELPHGCDTWALVPARANNSSCYRTRWPFPGSATGPDDMRAVSFTWNDLLMDHVPLEAILLVAFNASESRWRDDGRQWAGNVHVVDVLNGHRFARDACRDMRTPDEFEL